MSSPPASSSSGSTPPARRLTAFRVRRRIPARQSATSQHEQNTMSNDLRQAFLEEQAEQENREQAFRERTQAAQVHIRLDNLDFEAINHEVEQRAEGMSQNNMNNGPVQRQAPSPMSQPQNSNSPSTNGGNPGITGIGGTMPISAGQQMDVNFLFQRLVELGEVLKENREKTQGIVAGAEELATRAAANGATPSLAEANHEVNAARIADLLRQLSHSRSQTAILLREQRENTKLIGEYETELGQIVELIRNYAYSHSLEKTQLSTHYNKLLQDERDAHLATRLEKDEWHARFMRSVEMLRTAYGLRCKEEDVSIGIVAGLQNEVRAYRKTLGMEAERFEDELGYEILKDVPNGAGEP